MIQKRYGQEDNIIRICKFPSQEYEDIVDDGVVEISIVGKSNPLVWLSLK